MEEANKIKDEQKGEKTGVEEANLVMNWMNSVGLIGYIVCLYQLYGKDKQGTHNIRDFIYKIKNIIIYMLEI